MSFEQLPLHIDQHELYPLRMTIGSFIVHSYKHQDRMGKHGRRQRTGTISSDAVQSVQSVHEQETSSFSLFTYLLEAKDIQTLERRHQAVLREHQVFQVAAQQGPIFLAVAQHLSAFDAYAQAAANSLRLLVQLPQGSLLDRGKAIDVVCALCRIVGLLIIRYIEYMSDDYDADVAKQLCDELLSSGRHLYLQELQSLLS